MKSTENTIISESPLGVLNKFLMFTLSLISIVWLLSLI